jgi:hypothetical protein
VLNNVPQEVAISYQLSAVIGACGALEMLMADS